MTDDPYDHPELTDVSQHEARMEEMYARLGDLVDFDGVDRGIDRLDPDGEHNNNLTAFCVSCGEGASRGECTVSKRDCGHHCNHAWSHDRCCWCGGHWCGEYFKERTGVSQH